MFIEQDSFRFLYRKDYVSLLSIPYNLKAVDEDDFEELFRTIKSGLLAGSGCIVMEHSNTTLHYYC